MYNKLLKLYGILNLQLRVIKMQKYSYITANKLVVQKTVTPNRINITQLMRDVKSMF